MLVALYDEIIESILHIIDRLDLSVEKEKQEVKSFLIFVLFLEFMVEFRMKIMMEPQLRIQCLVCDL